jgi:hypothetical protein
MAHSKVIPIDKFRDAFKQTVSPLNPGTTELPPGHRKQPTFRPLTTTTIFDQDQVLTLRDGTKIYADVYRPKTDQKVPAIVMWGPYGKSGAGVLNIHTMPLRAGIPETRLSGYEDFEGYGQSETIKQRVRSTD